MTRATGALVAVLDANVLYPQWLRDVMLTLAATGYYDPVWSEQIIDEMRRNVLDDHDHIDPQQFDRVTIAALRVAFPNAWIEVPATLVAQMDNAAGDRHVLATAVTAPAELIVTANIVDFQSSRYVESGQVRIEKPADFSALPSGNTTIWWQMCSNTSLPTVVGSAQPVTSSTTWLATGPAALRRPRSGQALVGRARAPAVGRTVPVLRRVLPGHVPERRPESEYHVVDTATGKVSL